MIARHVLTVRSGLTIAGAKDAAMQATTQLVQGAFAHSFVPAAVISEFQQIVLGLVTTRSDEKLTKEEF